MPNLKKQMILLVLPLLAVLLPAAPVRADYYRFKGPDGVIRFTNVPTSSEYKWFRGESGRPYKYDSIEGLIDEVGRKYGVENELIKAVVRAESNFDPTAVSRAGARGLMQLMPETARMMGVEDIFDPGQNLDGGVKFLRHLLEKYEWQLPLALAAYNAGEDAVEKYGKVPPYKETLNYVKKVLKFRSIYNGVSR